MCSYWCNREHIPGIIRRYRFWAIAGIPIARGADHVLYFLFIHCEELDVKPTMPELDQDALRDLLRDARHAYRQARSGPYYPERGITRETLRAYADDCRATARKYRTKGAHDYIVHG